MKTVGIIAEYNPFHNGHAYQLRKAKERSGADTVIVVMSTSAVQRGEPSLLPPHARVQAALCSGADAVFALPALWAVQDAEHYALCGIHLLKLLQVDAISFGTETDDLAQLQVIADLLEENPVALQSVLKKQLEQGLPYPAALSAAVDAIRPGSADILARPNNTLALCYLRAIKRLHASFEIYPVQRYAAYHMEKLPESGFASASAIRSAVRSGDIDQIQSFVPSATFAQLIQGPIARTENLDAALLYRLRTMHPGDLLALPGCSEGLNDRMKQAARESTSREALLNQCKTRRYPYARLSRMCMHALLGITEGDIQADMLPETAWLLGFHDRALPWLRQAKERQLAISSRADDLPASRWLEIEQLSWEIFCLAANQPAHAVLSQRLVRISK